MTTTHFQRVLLVDAATGFYKMQKYRVGDFFGPVDLGLHLAGKHNSLNIGIGLLAGSIFPGSNRLIFNGFSPCWGGFYISSMGGAGLIFENLGVNMVSLVGKASTPSVLYLNRNHGEEIEVELVPVAHGQVWTEGRGGIYSMMDHVQSRFAERYKQGYRILATGPASMATDFGAIGSVPVQKGELSYVDTWAGRGGFGSKLFREHGIAGIIYGGTFIDDDFRDRKVADQWFENKYHKKLNAKDFEATTKYRFDPKFGTGGTFGVNYKTLGGRLFSFNYQSIYMDEAERLEINEKFIINHYLKQFNEETIETKQQRTCGEPCSAVCKKMRGKYKKDYEPYQTMGPLCGIFDQRAAEKLNHHADALGFDAISAGGVLSGLMECLSRGLVSKEELGCSDVPVFSWKNFSVETDSMHNAEIGVELLDAIIDQRGIVNLDQGARKWLRNLARERGKELVDPFVYNGFGRKGWIVPNQYWTPGVLSPMPIMGKYYMHYGNEFHIPRKLGQINSERFKQELIMDNLGICRFHRKWAEEMLPEIFGSLFGLKADMLTAVSRTATRINSRNSSIFWESERNIDLIKTFLERKRDIDGVDDPDLTHWIQRFDANKDQAALDYWYDIHKGIHESLTEY